MYVTRIEASIYKLYFTAYDKKKTVESSKVFSIAFRWKGLMSLRVAARDNLLDNEEIDQFMNKVIHQSIFTHMKLYSSYFWISSFFF